MVWVDEHELVPGDPLGERIAAALEEAKVVLVVVSSNSIKSKWLRYELNLATERMVKGRCRVVPVVLGDGRLPPEVIGLIYADFRSSYSSGLKSILTALQYEANKAASSARFWTSAEHCVEQVFGGRGSVSLMGNYESKSYAVVHLPIPNYEDDYTEVVYEVISSHARPVKPLTELWWDEYEAAIEKDEDLFLIITERPVRFTVEHPLKGRNRVGYRSSASRGPGRRLAQIVTADMSRANHEQQELILQSAKELLTKLALQLGAKDKKQRRQLTLGVYHTGAQ